MDLSIQRGVRCPYHCGSSRSFLTAPLSANPDHIQTYAISTPTSTTSSFCRAVPSRWHWSRCGGLQEKDSIHLSQTSRGGSGSGASVATGALSTDRCLQTRMVLIIFHDGPQLMARDQ